LTSSPPYLEHRVGSDLEDPRRGAKTKTFSQTRQDAHDEFHRRLFAMENVPWVSRK
jgi:hypothetical protein